MQLRSSVISSVFQKSLVLSVGARGQCGPQGVERAPRGRPLTPLCPRYTTGEIINLMSVDASRLQDLTAYMNTTWSGPFQIIVALVLLWQEVRVASSLSLRPSRRGLDAWVFCRAQMGPSCIGGVAVILALIPLIGFVSRKLKGLQGKVMTVKDERIKVRAQTRALLSLPPGSSAPAIPLTLVPLQTTNEVLSGMKVIKLQVRAPTLWARWCLQRPLSLFRRGPFHIELLCLPPFHTRTCNNVKDPCAARSPPWVSGRRLGSAASSSASPPPDSASWPPSSAT